MVVYMYCIVMEFRDGVDLDGKMVGWCGSRLSWYTLQHYWIWLV